MTCKSKRFVVLLLLLLSFSSSLWAQGTISDGAFELNYDPTSEDGNAGVSGPGPDQFQRVDYRD